MCKMRIEEAAKGDGVKSATWDAGSKIAFLLLTSNNKPG